jgi:starch synthase (maltosyl-transferring)
LREFYRPNVFVSTPEIVPYHLQSGEPWIFKTRLALAATLSSNYGVYNGFELLEHEPIPGREEYMNSEKYELKVRDWGSPGNIKAYISQLNRIRLDNPALHQTSQIQFLSIPGENIIAYVKFDNDKMNAVVTVVALTNDFKEFWLPLGDVQLRTSDGATHACAGKFKIRPYLALERRRSAPLDRSLS